MSFSTGTVPGQGSSTQVSCFSSRFQVPSQVPTHSGVLFSVTSGFSPWVNFQVSHLQVVDSITAYRSTSCLIDYDTQPRPCSQALGCCTYQSVYMCVLTLHHQAQPLAYTTRDRTNRLGLLAPAIQCRCINSSSNSNSTTRLVAPLATLLVRVSCSLPPGIPYRRYRYCIHLSHPSNSTLESGTACYHAQLYPCMFPKH